MIPSFKLLVDVTDWSNTLTQSVSSHSPYERFPFALCRRTAVSRLGLALVSPRTKELLAPAPAPFIDTTVIRLLERDPPETSMARTRAGECRMSEGIARLVGRCSASVEPVKCGRLDGIDTANFDRAKRGVGFKSCGELFGTRSAAYQRCQA
jgi:hypothetical protein